MLRPRGHVRRGAGLRVEPSSCRADANRLAQRFCGATRHMNAQHLESRRLEATRQACCPADAAGGEKGAGMSCPPPRARVHAALTLLVPLHQDEVRQGRAERARSRSPRRTLHPTRQPTCTRCAHRSPLPSWHSHRCSACSQATLSSCRCERTPPSRWVRVCVCAQRCAELGAACMRPGPLWRQALRRAAAASGSPPPRPPAGRHRGAAEALHRVARCGARCSAPRVHLSHAPGAPPPPPPATPRGVTPRHTRATTPRRAPRRNLSCAAACRTCRVRPRCVPGPRR